MGKLAHLPERLATAEMFGFFDDFEYFVTTDRFTSILTDSGTASVSDGAAGVLALVASDGTVADNDQTYVKGTKETFLFATDKPGIFEVRAKYTEANTDDANVMIGLKDAVAADTGGLADDGAGLPSSFTGALFYKLDGETVWSCRTQVATTKTTTATTVTAGDGTYKKFRIEWFTPNSTTTEVHFYINDVKVATHTLAHASATEMQVALGVKNGGANLETLYVDYVAAYQVR